MTFALLIRWHGDDGAGEWPAATGPFTSQQDAEREWDALIAEGECSPETHAYKIVPLNTPDAQATNLSADDLQLAAVIVREEKQFETSPDCDHGPSDHPDERSVDNLDRIAAGLEEMAARTSDLEQMEAGYVKAALWSSTTGDDGTPLDLNYGPEDLTVQAHEMVSKDCRTFATANAADLALYMERLGFGLEQAGHDLWLTRNGHGAGFWDRYHGPDTELTLCLDRLSDAARAMGSCDPYVTDSGGIDFS